MPYELDIALLKKILGRHGFLRSGEEIEVELLGGGVSNNVLRVMTPRQRLVIKQSLPKLRVQMDWYADQERIWRERDYLLLMNAWLPGCVPQVLFSDEEHFVLAISEVTGATLWKTALLAGQCSPTVAARAGERLAQIHTLSYPRPKVAERFHRKTPRSEDSFEQLRIDPYWRTVARRHPELAPAINQIIAAMEAHSLALVHGDYSPKNIFVQPGGDLVILDAEVAHWGDPTFDVAFCLNHFLLKAVYHGSIYAPFLDGAQRFWRAYQTNVQPGTLRASVAGRLAGQLSALFLARVDGKSPAEYLVGQPEKQSIVRNTACAALAHYPEITFDDLLEKLAVTLEGETSSVKRHESRLTFDA
jgi:aminoglycoside phosphotransferase (APT) family kinase protein